MKKLLAILLLICGTLFAQSDSVLQEIIRKNLRAQEIIHQQQQARMKWLAVGAYGFGALYSYFDATQDAITFSPRQITATGLTMADYHSLKFYRNGCLTLSGVSIGARSYFDWDMEKPWSTILWRLTKRVLGVGMLNYAIWDMSYSYHRYKTPISLRPERYKHPTGIDSFDKIAAPKTKIDVAVLHLVKFGIIGFFVALDEW